MRLPYAEHAVVDLAKLEDYCLNPAHPRGKHKAHVFGAVLGIRAEHAELLRDTLLEAARNSVASLGESDRYGERYVVDFRYDGPVGSAMVRSVWIVRRGESYPRLATCYVR